VLYFFFQTLREKWHSRHKAPTEEAQSAIGPN
jgi:hypothetical protein